MPAPDRTIELVMPSFLMPPLEMRHAARVSQDVTAQMTNITSRAWFRRRTIRLRTIRNVYVAEEGLVIHQDLALEPFSIRGHNDQNIARARNAIVNGKAASAIRRLEDDVVLCRSYGAWNYGHWLIEMLPLAYAAAKHWPRPARFLLQAVDGHLRGIIREAYDRLGIPANLRTEHGNEPIFVERLIVVEGLTDHGNYIAPLVLECLDSISAAITPDPNKKLFVSRGSAQTRRLPNEKSIAMRLMGNGFVCLAPGGASFAAQIAAFKGAHRIVGVIGATITNLAFAPRGAEIIMLSPATMPDTFFWFICGLRGIRLIDLRCRTSPSPIGNPNWDGALDLNQQDEDELVSAATTSPDPSLTSAAPVTALFDPNYYRASHGAAVLQDADPLEHYVTTGWREGFDPSPHFSTKFYLDTYGDVAASGMNPLLHYIAHGKAEGRLPKPDQGKDWGTRAGPPKPPVMI